MSNQSLQHYTPVGMSGEGERQPPSCSRDIQERGSSVLGGLTARSYRSAQSNQQGLPSLTSDRPPISASGAGTARSPLSAFTPFSAFGYQSTTAGARRPPPQYGSGVDLPPGQGLSLRSSGASFEQSLAFNRSRQLEAGANLSPCGGPSVESDLSPVNQVWKDPYRDELLAEIMRAEESVNIAERDLLSVHPALQRHVMMRKEKLQDETDLDYQRRRRRIFLIENGSERSKRFTKEFNDSYYPDMRLAYQNAGPWYNDAIALMEQTECDPEKRLRVFSEQLRKLKNISRPNDFQRAFIREYQQIVDKEQRIVAQSAQLQLGVGPPVQRATASSTAGSGGARPTSIQTDESLNARLGTLNTERRSFSFPTNLGRGTVDDGSGPENPRLGRTQASARPVDPVTAGRNNARADNSISSIGQPRNTIPNPAAGSDFSLFLMAGRHTAQTAQGQASTIHSNTSKGDTSRQITAQPSSSRIITTGKEVAVSKPRTGSADTPIASASIPPAAGASSAEISLGRAGSPRTGSVAKISSPRPGTGTRVPGAGSVERMETGGADTGTPRAGASRSSSGALTDPAVWSVASRSSSMEFSDKEQPTTTRSGVPETSEVPNLDPSAAAAGSAQPGTLTRGQRRRTVQKAAASPVKLQ